MSPTTLSYDELKEELTQQIEKAEHGVLATSDDNYVTAREMMLLSDGLKIMCFTGENTRKYKQLILNKNVALSINNLQIEGIATLTGHPSEERNAEFMRLFKEKFPKTYEFYSPICENPDSDAKVIEITPKRLTVYKPSGIDSHLDILNVVTETATKVGMEEMPTIDYSQF